MKQLIPAALVCLILLPIEAALLPHLGLGAARADFALCAVLWLAAGPASVIEGAVGAYLCGTVADLLYVVHPGLFALIAVLLFLLVRLGAGALEVRGAGSFALLCGVGSLAQALLARGFLALVGQGVPESFWSPALGGALLTAACAPVLFYALGRVTRGFEREESSFLGAGSPLRPLSLGPRRRSRPLAVGRPSRPPPFR